MESFKTFRKTFRLSPASIALMEECPRCFWLEKNKIWKRPETIVASLMNGMDKILKTHFDKFMKRGELPPEIRKHPDTKNLKLFDNEELLRKWRNNLKGISWTDEHGNTLYGAIDNLLVNKDKLIVLDYKTRGFPLKENTSERYQTQLDIYNLLLRKNGFETEDFSFLLFYIPKEILETGEIIFDSVLVKKKVNPNNAEIIFKKAINLLNSECPSKSCDWCYRL
ncbi:MAG: hypothetical protein KatS3mg001_339 [Candidatus Pacearchaeota archaeon]|nr:MAG: hypothetical protein KatS3mg001_339 [Candidatus Pacearchaeota archaeon]